VHRLSHIAIEFGRHLKRQLKSGVSMCVKRNLSNAALSAGFIPLIDDVKCELTYRALRRVSGWVSKMDARQTPS
jgi:hypothetical protein